MPQVCSGLPAPSFEAVRCFMTACCVPSHLTAAAAYFTAPPFLTALHSSMSAWLVGQPSADTNRPGKEIVHKQFPLADKEGFR